MSSGWPKLADNPVAETASHVDRFASPYAFIRFGGLPFDRLLRLRFDRTIAVFREALAIEAALKEESHRLSEQLYPCAPQIADVAARRVLLDLRRSVFNRRLPRQGTRALAILRPYLPRSLRASLIGWYRRARRVSLMEKRLPEVFAHEMRERRMALRELLARPDFLRGVLLSSTDFFDAIQRYLAAPNTAAGSAEHLETSAMLYLGRMGAKTSPFGTFTPTALGQIDSQAPGGCGLRLEGESESRTRLNSALVHLIGRYIARLPAVRSTLRVAPGEGAWIEGNEIQSLRAHYKWKPIYGRHDTISRIPRLPAIEQVLSLVQAEGVVPYGELLRRVSRASAGRDAVAVSAIEKLLEFGLLEIRLPIGPHETNVLDSLIRFLEPFTELTVARCREGLARMRILVSGYAAAQPDARWRLVGQLRRELAELETLLAAPAETFQSLDLIREDVFLPGISWRAGDRFCGILEQDLAPLFEALKFGHVQHSETVRRFFLEEADPDGRVGNVLSFFARYAMAIRDRLDRERDSVEREATPFLLMADQLLRRLNEVALQLWTAQGRSGREVELDPALLPRDLPDLHGWPVSVTAFFQVAAADAAAFERGDYLLVLNVAQSGLGSYAARFCGLYGSDGSADPLSDMLRRHLPSLCDRAEVVDFPFSTDSSDVQLHPKLTDRYWRWPLEAAEANAIGSAQVELRHDSESGALRLVERSSGREILPIYLGGIHPQFFPLPAPALINNLTPTCHPFIRDFWRPGGAGCLGGAPENGRVQHLPRVRIGRLVVARESWRVPSEEIPRPEKKESGLSYFWRVYRWSRSIGLPEIVFAKAQVESLASAVNRKSKPLWLDFSNPWSAWAIPRLLLPEVRQVVFTEMLPSPEEMFLTRDGSAVVSEFQVEINWKPC